MTTIRFQLGDATAVAVPAALVERYGKPVPRYTSYPPVPDWANDVGPAEVAAALGNTRAPVRSIYVHLPFCRKRCYYCGCNVVISKSLERAERYVEAVLAEARLVAAALADRRPVVQMHWGGGTPTFLPPNLLARLAAGLREQFVFSADAELGLEADPRVTDLEQLATLREFGFNRLSLGVQDLDDIVQQTIGRVQPEPMTAELIRGARRLGYASINVDLVYGLPHQSRERFAETLQQVLAWRPDRIATFGYAHLPQRFKHQRAIPDEALPQGAERLALFAQAIDAFTQAGYRFIGLDHFARDDDELTRAHDAGTLTRNFMGYSTRGGADLIGLGASAISGLHDVMHAQNEPDERRYRETLEAGDFATVRGHRLTADDRLRREAITRLMCNGNLARDELVRDFPQQLAAGFDAAFPGTAEALAPLQADGLVEDDGNLVRVTPLGRLFIRHIAAAFDACQQAERTAALSKGV